MYGSMAKKTLKGDEIAEILNRETAKWVQTLLFLCFCKEFSNNSDFCNVFAAVSRSGKHNAITLYRNRIRNVLFFLVYFHIITIGKVLLESSMTVYEKKEYYAAERYQTHGPYNFRARSC